MFRPHRAHVLTFVLILCLLPILTFTNYKIHAQTLVVTTPNDMGPGSLRQAIADAHPGDTITFAPGATDATNGVLTIGSTLTIDKVIKIEGPGPSALTLHPDFHSNSGHVIVFSVPEVGSLNISNLQIMGESGPFISNSGKLTVDRVLFHGTDKKRLEKTANGWSINGGSGKAIYNAGEAVIKNSSFVRSGSIGGEDGTEGGAIFHQQGNITIINSTFQENYGSQGGAILFYKGTGSIISSTFSDNIGRVGGAIYIDTEASVSIANSTITNNSLFLPIGLQPINQGGGIYNKGNLTIVNSTIANNSGFTGFNLFNDAEGRLKLQNTIVTLSSPGTSCAGDITDGGNNLQYPDTSCGQNIRVGDPRLGPLADNGGSTFSMALLPGSAAIDAGNADSCAAEEVANIDQRGTSRQIDGNGDGQAVCDIGAFEAGLNVASLPTLPVTNTPTMTYTPSMTPTIPSPTPTVPTATPVFTSQTLIVTKLADTDDGICDAADCSLREAIKSAAFGATISFDPMVFGTMALQKELVIDKSLTINGPGATTLTISAERKTRVITIPGNYAIYISGLTIANGYIDAYEGMPENEHIPRSGGGIANYGGNLTLSNVTIFNNYAFAGGAVYNGVGSVLTLRRVTAQKNESADEGAIANLGNLTVNSSLFLQSRAARGSAIGNEGSAYIVNSTFTDNFATEDGGAIANIEGKVVILNSTIANNIAWTAGGGIFATNETGNGALLIRNSIISGNKINFDPNQSQPGQDNNCAGTITDGGNNLQYPVPSCPSSIPVLDPKLGTLGSYGGSTQTINLLAGSPAIDAGNAEVCGLAMINNVDQRGTPRTVDGNGDGQVACDIGAVEYNRAPIVAAVPTDTTPSLLTPPPPNLNAPVAVIPPSADANSVPAPTITPIPRSLALVGGAKAIVNADYVTLYTQPKTGSAKIMDWARGTLLVITNTVTNSQGTWWRVRGQRIEGYIQAKVGTNPSLAVFTDDVLIKAFEAATTAIEKAPKDAAAYDRRGLINLARQKSNEALVDFTEAIRLDPKLATPLYHRALTYIDINNNQLAIPDIDAAIKLEPNNAVWHNLRGSLLSDQKKSAEALQEFVRAIALNPEFATPYNNRGAQLANSGNTDKALVDFNKVIELDPYYTIAYMNRAIGKGATQDYVGYVEDIDQAILVEPTYSRAYVIRGTYWCCTAGDLPKAVNDFTRAIELDPNTLNAYAYRAHAFYLAGNLQLALSDAAIAATTGAVDITGYAEIVEIYSFAGNMDKVIEIASKAIKIDPTIQVFYAQRGRAYLLQNNRQAAIADLTFALTLETTRQWMPVNYVYMERGIAYYQNNELEKSLADYNQSITLYPTPEAYENRALTYYALKQYDLAIADCNDAINLNPNTELSYWLLGEIYYAQKNWALSLKNYQSYTARSQSPAYGTGDRIQELQAKLGTPTP